MPKNKYHVRLTKKEKDVLLETISKGSTSAKEIMHANILLAADENSVKVRKSESEIAALFMSTNRPSIPFDDAFLKKGLMPR
jgi:hypothetical protein